MYSVSNIFGGSAKVKVMRLFVFNPESTYSTKDVVSRTKEKATVVGKELRTLAKAGLLKRRTKGYILDQAYPYLEALKRFFVDASPLTHKEISNRLARVGSIKLIIVAGVFLHDPEARVDLLVVGDHIRQSALVNVIAAMEAELGKELRYASFETADFRYRVGMYDKLIRDVIDHNHDKIVNKLGI